MWMDHEGYEDIVRRINKRYREAEERTIATTTTSNKADIRTSQKKDYTDRNWEPEKSELQKRYDQQNVTLRERVAKDKARRLQEELPQPPAPPEPGPAPPSSTWDWAQAPETSTIEEWESSWHTNPTTRRQIRDWHSKDYWKDS
jgi:hypothetical protein